MSATGGTVGRKLLMAVSGAVIIGYLVIHMAGNLLFFAGPDAINVYAAGLKSLPPLVWAVRITLLLAAAVHVWSAASLYRIARAARPQPYELVSPQASTVASRTMRIGGVLLLLFIVFHLLHLTVGSLHPDFQREDVRSNILVGMAVWPVAAFYLLAMAALALHLSHGIWSGMQTMGWSGPRVDKVRKVGAVVFAVVLTLGFSAVVVAGALAGAR